MCLCIIIHLPFSGTVLKRLPEDVQASTAMIVSLPGSSYRMLYSSLFLRLISCTESSLDTPHDKNCLGICSNEEINGQSHVGCMS